MVIVACAPDAPSEVRGAAGRFARALRVLTAAALVVTAAGCATRGSHFATRGESAGDAASTLTDRMRERSSGVALTALNFVGVPYRYGGNSADTGFDCSGFTREVVAASLGVTLPRTVDEQANAPALAAIGRDALVPGDLVFFDTLRRTYSHVGIYIGDGRFVHSPRPGGVVRIENMRSSYWAPRFTGGRRADRALVQAGGDPPAGVAEASGDAPLARR